MVECPGQNPCRSGAGSRWELPVESTCQYKVHGEESFPGLLIGVPIDGFQIARIRHNMTECAVECSEDTSLLKMTIFSFIVL